MKDFVYILIIIVLVGFMLGRSHREPDTIIKSDTVTITQIDTLIQIDTFQTEVFIPKWREKVKLDTVFITENFYNYLDTVTFSDKLKVYYRATGIITDMQLGAIDTRETIVKETTNTITNTVSKDGLYLGVQGGPSGFGVGGNYIHKRLMFSAHFGTNTNIGVSYRLW